MPSIVQATNNVVGRDGEELRKVLAALLADVTAIRTAVTAVTAKLDADATVTDTNYASTCNPAALTTTS